ncbi:MAG: DUF1294 domain-containing protein [Bacteroidaceae bacterium]|nr:DUF1294 domain-containing protein [Bacteroidaceae bacterium]
MLWRILTLYLIGVNVVTFVLYGVDKRRARKGDWRISEATLLLHALAGGALGALLGMKVFRHKTRHWRFRLLVPFALILWMVGLGYLLFAGALTSVIN